jgi:hypothetical protein
MGLIEREAILKAAMEAGCDEADRLGYGSELGYVEAASIGEKAATVALDQLQGAVEALLAAPMPEVESTLKGEEWAERYGEWWHEYVRPHVIGGQ